MAGSEKINSLTGVRGLTALWVILYHAAIVGETHGTFFDNFAGRGWLGVDVFFVLSGFVIAHVYRTKLATFSWSGARDFYVKRLARIYPAHLAVLGGFLALVAAAIILRVPYNVEAYSLESLAAQLLMINGVGLPLKFGWNIVSWTVSSEFFAYLLFPFMAPLLLRLSRAASVAGVLAIFCLTFGLAWAINDGRTYFLPWHLTTTRVVSEFVLGCLMYALHGSAIFQRHGRHLAPAAFAAIVLVAGLSSASLVDGYLVALFVLFVPAVASDRTSLLSRVLCSRPLVLLGEISYSVYMVQCLVQIVVKAALEKLTALGYLVPSGYVLPALVTMVVSILCAIPLYRQVEKLGQKFLLDRLLAPPNAARRMKAA